MINQHGFIGKDMLNITDYQAHQYIGYTSKCGCLNCSSNIASNGLQPQSAALSANDIATNRIDALFYPGRPKWGTLVSGNEITYNFMESLPTIYTLGNAIKAVGIDAGGVVVDTFQPFDSNQRKAAQDALDIWAEVANITFKERQDTVLQLVDIVDLGIIKDFLTLPLVKELKLYEKLAEALDDFVREKLGLPFPIVQGSDIRFGTDNQGTESSGRAFPPPDNALREVDELIKDIADLINDKIGPAVYIIEKFNDIPLLPDIPIPKISNLIKLTRAKFDVYGDVWINNADANNSSGKIGIKGGDGFQTLLHEIGHALGLKHPGDYNAGGGKNPGPYLPSAEDNYKYSIMSYHRFPGHREVFPTTPMLYDIAAIQALYGKNNNTRSGDSTYSWDNPFVATIWDAGGNDTISAANQSLDAVINLNAGEFSSIGSTGQIDSVTGRSTKIIDNLAIAFDVLIENAIGGSGNDTLIGNSVSNVLQGGRGNDTLIGRSGGDTLIGNDGIDTADYSKSDTGVSVNLITGVGVGGDAEGDTLQSIENLTGSDYGDTLVGNAGSNKLYGLNGNDSLAGGEGDDILDGGSGNDSMLGGKGNDTYYVDSTNDTTIENANEGTDTVYSSVSYMLAENLEDLNLTGNNAINGTGNSIDNIITGNSANNILKGEAGNDTLNAGEGDDTLDGGLGSDFMFGGQGNDSYFVDNINDSVTELANEGTDIVFSSITYMLGNNLENLTLTGNNAINGTGNSLNNIITANNADNYLYAGDGDDTVYGQAGNDYLYGQSGNDTLFAGDGNDSLDGGFGTNSMFGGLGNDSYFVDSIDNSITEFANEGTDIVYSSITYKLGDNLENLTLTSNSSINGIGNIINNIINGNDATNTLDGKAGNDILFGNGGNDSLFGDVGDDKLIGGVGFDILNGGDGIDTASYFNSTSGIFANLSTGQGADGDASGDVYQFIENLEGSEFSDRLFGDNQNNSLCGLGGDDTLNGLAGGDLMEGGLGNDTYFIDDAGDKVTEFINQGVDLVNSAINYILASNFENLNLIEGTAAFNGTGNELNNIINGNSANNIIDGAAGNDVLYGFAGNDTINGGDGDDWIYSGIGNESVPGGTGIITGIKGSDILTGGNGNDYFAYNKITEGGDIITDFTVGSDKVVLTEVVNSSGLRGYNLLGDVFSFRQANNTAVMLIDTDGAGSLFRPTPFLLFNNVSATALNNSNNFIL